MKKIFLLVVLLLAVAVTVIGCSDDKSSGSNTGTNTPPIDGGDGDGGGTTPGGDGDGDGGGTTPGGDGDGDGGGTTPGGDGDGDGGGTTQGGDGDGDGGGTTPGGDGDGDGGGTTPPTDTDVVAVNEVLIGETGTFSYTFKNPNADESLIYIQTASSNPVLQVKDSTCGEIVDGEIDSILEAGKECVVNYTFAPTQLSTEVLTFGAEIMPNMENPEVMGKLCANLTPESAKKFITPSTQASKILNYAKDSSGAKSADIIKVIYKSDYAVTAGLSDGITQTHNTTQSIKFDKGTYTIDDTNIKIGNLTIEALDSNCSISGKEITANGNACNMYFSFETSAPFSKTIFFKSNDNTKIYMADIIFDYEYQYDVYNLDTAKFTIGYDKLLGDDFFYGYKEIRGFKINKTIDYKLEGADAAKFQVKPTPVDGCVVTDNKIIYTTGDKPACFFTIDFTDDVKNTSSSADYTATFVSTDGGANINITGTVEDIMEMLQGMCGSMP